MARNVLRLSGLSILDPLPLSPIPNPDHKPHTPRPTPAHSPSQPTYSQARKGPAAPAHRPTHPPTHTHTNQRSRPHIYFNLLYPTPTPTPQQNIYRCCPLAPLGRSASRAPTSRRATSTTMRPTARASWAGGSTRGTRACEFWSFFCF